MQFLVCNFCEIKRLNRKRSYKLLNQQNFSYKRKVVGAHGFFYCPPPPNAVPLQPTPVFSMELCWMLLLFFSQYKHLQLQERVPNNWEYQPQVSSAYTRSVVEGLPGRMDFLLFFTRNSWTYLPMYYVLYRVTQLTLIKRIALGFTVRCLVYSSTAYLCLPDSAPHF